MYINIRKQEKALTKSEDERGALSSLRVREKYEVIMTKSGKMSGLEKYDIIAASRRSQCEAT